MFSPETKEELFVRAQNLNAFQIMLLQLLKTFI
jgi:hypothetical protein